MHIMHGCEWLYTERYCFRKNNEGRVIVSVNKWEQKLNEVPNKIVKINKLDILRNNPQTSADLLGQTGSIFIQKSQLGGGSPMIRGFATNRVLLVIDDVGMNNAIYRSGNLQNVLSIDALSTETAEVIFGPGSLIYGSDAIGGVMDFHTLDTRFSKDKKILVKGSVLGRYSTANPPGPGVLGLAEDGRVGVFVVSGPYEARKPTGAPATTGAKLALGDRPSGMPPSALSEALVCAGGDPDPCSRRTTVEIARSGVVDLKERLAPRGEALAYATFTLTTEGDFRGFLLLSVDDGVRVSVDGKVIHARDEGRPPRDDDDAVPLSLSAGRHVVSLELHQHDGPWQVAARIVDEGLAPPTGLDVEVPSGAAALAACILHAFASPANQ